MTMTSSQPAIAFVVAHPDDVAFSMGGTAALLKGHYCLHVFCASRGERGYDWKGEGPAPPDEKIAAAREEEERASSKLIGAALTFLDQPDGEIFAGAEVCRRVAGHLAEIQPIAVFTHGPLAKPDHAATCQIARHALHLAGIFWETQLYMSESLRHANVFVNTTGVIEQKKQQVFCHQHHLHDPSYWDQLLQEDRLAGKLAVCEYAEGYLTQRPLVDTRWGRKAGSILLDLAAEAP